MPNMAPQFKAHAKHPAVTHLVRLHADIGGRIKVNRKEYDRLVADMKAVEAVIRMFDPAYDVAGIVKRRRRARRRRLADAVAACKMKRLTGGKRMTYDRSISNNGSG